MSGPNLPLAHLLSEAVSRAPSGGCLVSVLIGEAVLGQRRLAAGARIRALVADALLSELPDDSLVAADGSEGLALLVTLDPASTARAVEAALRSVAVIRTATADLRITPAAAVSPLHPHDSTDTHGAVQVSEDLAACRKAAVHALEQGDLRVLVCDDALDVELVGKRAARTERGLAFARQQAVDLRRRRLAQATAEADDERQLPAEVVNRRPLGRRQIVATYLLSLLVPFAAYLGAAEAGVNLLPLVYPTVVLALAGTAAMIVVESLMALSPVAVPPLTTKEPAASALVVAYLPNEQGTVMATVHNLLAQDYAGGLQVVLAYNTPTPLPVERELEQLAARDRRFTAIRVEHSSSKAANVNAALPFCTGEFIGVFDADHLPAQGSFSRAWRWLQPSVGNDVVQGHCVVRDAERGRLARTVAMEFEAIYAVAHPGRARLHGFGVFGGSNGYWRAERLHTTRMHEEMLTEDIDATARLLLSGGRIISDPGLVSTELAPASLRSLWTQRMRWAQGWHQVSRRHLLSLLTNEHFSLRQKAGAAWLFGWRELYPWVSLQSLPIVAAAVLLAGPNHKSWVLPLFVISTAFTVLNGPLQVLLAWRVAVPELRVRTRWWLAYLLLSVPYAEMKNLIGRVAQVKEMIGERHWQVTTRPLEAPAPAPVLVGALR